MPNSDTTIIDKEFSAEADLIEGLNEEHEFADARDVTSDRIDGREDMRSVVDCAMSFFLKTGMHEIDRDFHVIDEEYFHEFRYLDVEPLVDQGAKLLDRVLADRREWETFAVKGFTLALELREFIELDDIHKDEEKAGYYTLPFRRLAHEVRQNRLQTSGHTFGLQLLNHIRNEYWTHDEMNRNAGAIQLASWGSALPFTTDEWNETHLKSTFDGHEREKHEHLKYASDIRSHQDQRTRGYSIWIQRYIQEMSRDASNERTQSAQLQREWNRSDIEFRKRRTAVARKLHETRLQAATLADGVLNYVAKMQRILVRAEYDLSEAIARLSAVDKGMKLLYGYGDRLPNTCKIDDYVLWTRRCTNWLVRFSRLSQGFVQPVSIRQLVGEEAWENGLIGRKWTVPIDEQLFVPWRHVRMRGMNAVLVGSPEELGVWCLDVLAPRQSTVTHLDDTTEDLVQTSVPLCRIGRTAARNYVRRPDFVGVASLHNASPFGEWKVEVGETSSEGTSINWIKDIQLDLHVSGRWPG